MSHELRLGDCLEGMASLPDRSVTHWICDPPYSEHVHSKSRRGLTVTHRGGATDEISERRDLGFGSLTLDTLQAAAAQFARTARRWILVFSDVESSHLWRIALEDSGAEYVRTLAWVKLGGAPQFTGDRPAVGFEAIVAAHAPGTRKRWNGGGKRGVYEHTRASTAAARPALHPTEKPLPLIEALVSDFTDAGELVADPFSGSCTTGAACKRLGRSFLGWEIDPGFYQVGRKRLDAAREQFQLPRMTRPKQLPLRGSEKETA